MRKLKSRCRNGGDSPETIDFRGPMRVGIKKDFDGLRTNTNREIHVTVFPRLVSVVLDCETKKINKD